MEPEEQLPIELTPLEELPTYTTACDHYWVLADSDPNSNLVSVRCTNCPAGSNIDSDHLTLKDGKMVKKDG